MPDSYVRYGYPIYYLIHYHLIQNKPPAVSGTGISYPPNHVIFGIGRTGRRPDRRISVMAAKPDISRTQGDALH